jgi:hypothetical protein
MEPSSSENNRLLGEVAVYATPLAPMKPTVLPSLLEICPVEDKDPKN